MQQAPDAALAHAFLHSLLKSLRDQLGGCWCYEATG